MENNNKPAKKSGGLGLRETRGGFEIVGIVSGTSKERFYSERMARNNKPFRSINFGVSFDKNKTAYLGFLGMENENVYFMTRDKSKGKDAKSETVAVPWRNRFEYPATNSDARLIGVTLGLSKRYDDKGIERNEVKRETQFDACLDIFDNLRDDMSVFTRGNITYSTYEGRRQVRFEPNQISLCKSAIDFDDKEFLPRALFTQELVFMGIEPDQERKGIYAIRGKIVTYNGIEDAELFTSNETLAKNMKRHLRPYNLIELFGDIDVDIASNTQELQVEDQWGGKPNKMTRVNAPISCELFVTGINVDKIDTDTYSEQIIDDALAKIVETARAKADFGSSKEDSSPSWGSAGKKMAEADDDEANLWA